MSNSQTSGRPLQRYTVTYEIRDGDHDYADQTLVELFDHEPTEDEVLRALIDDLRYDTDPEAMEEAVEEFKNDGCFMIPGDSRAVRDFSWEKEQDSFSA